jgi:hypothetical protein
MTQLERGLVTDAERKNNLKATTIQNFLNRYSYKNKTNSIIYWTKIINENFDDKVNEERDFLQSRQGETDSPRPTTTASAPQPRTTEVTENQYRACSASFKTLTRQDLPQGLRDTFTEQLQDALEQSTNYITDYGLQIFKLMLLLKEYTFNFVNDEIILEKTEGFSLQEILPRGFEMENGRARVAPSLSSEALKTDDFKKHYKYLFSSDHLNLIHSTYFGQQGTHQSTLDKCQVHSAMVSIIPRIEDSQPDIENFVMKTALSQYITNFNNMWSSKARFNKIIRNLLMVLLRQHLAPKRERQKNKCIKRKTQKKDKGKSSAITSEYVEPIPFEEISLINLTRNQKRTLFDEERRRYITYINKAETEENDFAQREKWYRRAERCQQRLDTYDEVLKSEVNKKLM